MAWQCSSRFKDKTGCKTPHLTEDEIREAFITALNRVLPIREEFIAKLKDVQSSIGGTEQPEAEADRLMEELAAIANTVQQTIDENAQIAQNQEDYRRRYDEQADRYKKTENELKTVQETIRMQNERCRRISGFINELEALPESITEFRIDHRGHLVDRVTVCGKDRITFTFTTGLEV
jgi:regulator of replication initiation timing